MEIPPFGKRRSNEDDWSDGTFNIDDFFNERYDGEYASLSWHEDDNTAKMAAAAEMNFIVLNLWIPFMVWYGLKCV